MVRLEQVVDRMGQFGYKVSETEHPAIEFEMEYILDYVVNYCNFTSRDAIPEILDRRIIDRICSEYFMKQRNSNNLDMSDSAGGSATVDVGAIKSIKEGDTQIQFETGSGASGSAETPATRFDKFIDYMYKGFDKWISPYRRLKW